MSFAILLETGEDAGGAVREAVAEGNGNGETVATAGRAVACVVDGWMEGDGGQCFCPTLSTAWNPFAHAISLSSLRRAGVHPRGACGAAEWSGLVRWTVRRRLRCVAVRRQDQ